SRRQAATRLSPRPRVCRRKPKGGIPRILRLPSVARSERGTQCKLDIDGLALRAERLQPFSGRVDAEGEAHLLMRLPYGFGIEAFCGFERFEADILALLQIKPKAETDRPAHP